MERAQIQSILTGWRPGTRLDDDPDIRTALAHARSEPELATWLEGHARRQEETTRALRDIPVPSDLAAEILARARLHRPNFGRRAAIGLALAASLVALLTGLWAVLPSESGNDLATFRRRMVRAAIREYRMDIETQDLTAIRSFLARSQAPADFELPPGLNALQPVGGGALPWQQGRTAMVCLNGGADGMLYLFIVPATELKGAVPNEPELARVNQLSTSTWTRDGKTFVLASSAPLEALRKYL